MKKILSVSLALILIFSCLTVTGFAADEAEAPTVSEEILPPDTAEDEELQRITAALTEVTTYIYNYATQPQEPAVDLETVIKIVTVIVKIVYTIYKNYQSQNSAALVTA